MSGSDETEQSPETGIWYRRVSMVDHGGDDHIEEWVIDPYGSMAIVRLRDLERANVLRLMEERAVLVGKPIRPHTTGGLSDEDLGMADGPDDTDTEAYPPTHPFGNDDWYHSIDRAVEAGDALELGNRLRLAGHLIEELEGTILESGLPHPPAPAVTDADGEAAALIDRLNKPQWTVDQIERHPAVAREAILHARDRLASLAAERAELRGDIRVLEFGLACLSESAGAVAAENDRFRAALDDAHAAADDGTVSHLDALANVMTIIQAALAPEGKGE